jgi:hypothetical protein
MGRTAAEALLPYTAERMDAMLDMAKAGLSIDASTLGTSMDVESGVGGGASRDDEFGGFDTAKSEFAHKCPRCGFGCPSRNTPKCVVADQKALAFSEMIGMPFRGRNRYLQLQPSH